MKQDALYNRFKQTITLLCLAIVALWAVFYTVVKRGLEDNALSIVEQVSKNVIFSLENRFLSIENISYTMSGEPALIEMLKAGDTLGFYDLASKATGQVEAIAAAETTVSNILLYDSNGRFYRFKGGMSNTALSSAFKELSPDGLPGHLTCTSDGRYYIGYSVGIDEDGLLLGYTAVFMEEMEIKRILELYDKLPSLGIALTAEGNIVYSNREGFSQGELIHIKSSTAFYDEKKIGLTPFTVFVFYDNTAADRISVLFSVIMLVTVALLFFIVFRFIKFWRQHFFHPIGGVIREVEQFDGEMTRALKPTGEAYFDGLVTQLNWMLRRIVEKEAELVYSRELLYQTELKKQRALIVSLKKQINAHFTVNSLNTIRALIKKKENDRAEEICDGLSGLLQYANAGDETITVLEEFSMLERYLAIMQTRYPGRFSAELEFDDELAEVCIPRMLLQPVVENAILHAFHHKEGGMLQIACIVQEVTLRLSVTDNGCGMDKNTLTAVLNRLQNDADDVMEEGLSHVALSNIQKRIQTSFGSGYGIEIASRLGDGTRVTLILPASLSS